MITEIKIICSNAGIAILDPNQQYFLADYFQFLNTPLAQFMAL